MYYQMMHHLFYNKCPHAHTTHTHLRNAVVPSWGVFPKDPSSTVVATTKCLVVMFFVCSLLWLISLIYFAHGYVHFRSSVKVKSPSTRAYSVQSINNADEFDLATLKSINTIPSVIDFQKSKCKPCIRVAPEYEQLSKKYAGRVNFYKVDADTSKEALAILKSQGIRSVPTFHLWANGSQVSNIQGAHLDELEDELKKIVDSGHTV